MKYILILLTICILFSSCDEVSQYVTYSEENGYCVNTYTNGMYIHGFDDFNVITCGLSKEQVDSVRKQQYKLSQEYLKVAK